MKYLKTFENLTMPKMYDYVLVKKPTDTTDELINNINTFLNNNIGKIVGITRESVYYVQYDNIPKYLFKNFNYEKNSVNDIQYENYRIINLKDIIYFSDKLFDINIIKNAEKYNL